jgi:thiamine-phosphate pyrophosphorylase
LTRVVLCADAARWPGDHIVAVVERLLPLAEPGTLVVWDRQPEAAQNPTTDRDRLRRLVTLRRLTADHGHRLVVGGRVDLAVASVADGVHLPERGLDPPTVRRGFPGLEISRSCHDRAGLDEALRKGASWATLSPFATPGSASRSGPPLGEAGFAEIIRGLDLPVVALGGLWPGLVAACRRSGAQGVAISGAVFDADDPEAVLDAILSCWSEA